MTQLPSLKNNLRLPLIAAPMFLVSGPELVIETCRRGVIGTFPALNQRTSDGFVHWLEQIKTALREYSESGEAPAQYGVNLIVHDSNPRLETDLQLCVEHKVPLVITSLGAVPDVVEAVHSYGGKVFHDIINLRHAQKAAGAGVDGLIAVCAGAGGHAGLLSPVALVSEIKKFFDGDIILSGCLSSGGDLAAATVLGADYGYMGTRFINTKESMAASEYKSMIAESAAADIVYTDKVSGVYANFLGKSLQQAGLADMPDKSQEKIDFGKELMLDEDNESKAWKDIWSAGQGVGSIHETLSVEDLIERLVEEYQHAGKELQHQIKLYS